MVKVHKVSFKHLVINLIILLLNIKHLPNYTYNLNNLFIILYMFMVFHIVVFYYMFLIDLNDLYVNHQFLYKNIQVHLYLLIYQIL